MPEPFRASFLHELGEHPCAPGEDALYPPPQSAGAPNGNFPNGKGKRGGCAPPARSKLRFPPKLGSCQHGRDPPRSRQDGAGLRHRAGLRGGCRHRAAGLGLSPPCVSRFVLNDAKQGWSWRLGLITFNYNNCCLSPVFCISPWGESRCCFFSSLAPASPLSIESLLAPRS